jgi:hypothetical protein
MEVHPQIEDGWKEALAEEFRKPYFAALKEFLIKEKSLYPVFPPAISFSMPSTALRSTSPGGHSGSGPLPRARTGTRPVFLRSQRRSCPPS